MTKTYNKFIDVLEIVYAILMSWGFARIAENFDFSNIYNWAGLIVCGFVLIRFFFAPSHNVGGLIRSINMDIVAARKVIFLDIPVLIAHSFIYYRMCYNVAVKNYTLFYVDYAILLILNAVWLFYIRKRLKAANAAIPDKFFCWVNNNLVAFLLIIGLWVIYASLNLLSTFLYFWLSFLVALVNCTIDLSSCALVYFEDV